MISTHHGVWSNIDKDFLDSYPGVVATSKAVQENEQVKTYLEAKNCSDFDGLGWMAGAW